MTNAHSSGNSYAARMFGAERRAVMALLPLFVAVAEAGQVSAGADDLGLPQPTVTRSLQRLAALVGTPLLERRGRTLQLTEAGRTFLPFARAALERLDAGLDELARGSALEGATVSLAFQTLLGERVVPDLIRSFRDRFPRTRFRLTQGSRALCLEALEAGDADIALVAEPPQLAGTRTLHLFRERLYATVAPDHPLATEREVSVAALAPYDLALLKHGFGLRAMAEALFAAAGIVPRVVYEAEDFHTARGLAAAGLAAAILPADPMGSRPQVRELVLADRVAVRTVGALVSTREDPALAAFEETLQRFAAGHADEV